MKFFALLLMVVSGQFARAASVQVPENCVDRIIPCMVRADQSSFRFLHKGIEVQLNRESILKITGNAEHLNFEIISGLAILTEKVKSSLTYSLGNVAVDSEKILASRHEEKLQILSLNNFSFAEYKIGSENFPVRISAEFINKKDLVSFSRLFFNDGKEYRGFLTSVEPHWKSEFKRQNISQTKALLRSIASQQQQEQELLLKKQKQEKELKKVRDEFFYRTFYR